MWKSCQKLIKSLSVSDSFCTPYWECLRFPTVSVYRSDQHVTVPMVHLYPTPDEKGIQDTVQYYRSCGIEISTEQAYEVLYAVMRFLWLINQQPAA